MKKIKTRSLNEPKNSFYDYLPYKIEGDKW